MRILQVVSLISPQGEYGGPTRVALAHCQALREAGHEVVLAAGSWGYDPVPDEVEGVRVRLFPAYAPVRGSFHGLASPGLAAFVARTAPTADVVHVHLARDLVTLPAGAAALVRHRPYVVQTHGMVVPSGNPLAPALDLLMTRRILRGAGRVLYLTDAERAGLQEVASPLRLEFLRNGISVPEPSALPAGPGRGPQILFLARVQARKHPLDFVEMARRLAPRHPDTTFRMIGPDEGQGAELRAAIAASGLGDRLVWEGHSLPRRLVPPCEPRTSTSCPRWTSPIPCLPSRRCLWGALPSSPIPAVSRRSSSAIARVRSARPVALPSPRPWTPS